MKTPKHNSPLHELIQRLSSGEKRFFQLRYSGYKENGQILELYQILKKQKVYNTDLVKKQLNPKSRKYYSALSNKLFQQLLNCLVDYQHAQHHNTHLDKLIAQAQVLLKKSMNQQSEKLLNKAQKRAWEIEDYLTLLKINETRETLLLNTTTSNSSIAHVELLKENQRIIELYQNQQQIYTLFSRLKSLYIQQQTLTSVKSDLEDILNHPLLQDINNAKSFKAKLNFLNIFVVYYVSQNRLKDLLPLLHDQKQMFDENPAFKKVRLREYIRIFSNYLHSANALKKMDILEEYLDEFELIAEIYSNEITPELKRLHNAKLLSLHISKMSYDKTFNKLPFWAQKTREILVGNETQFDIGDLLVIYYNIMHGFWLTEDFSTAIDWGNIIWNLERQTILQELHAYSRIMNIIAHYELGNYEYLHSLHNQLNNYINNYQIKNQYFKRIISFVKKNMTHKLSPKIFKIPAEDFLQKLNNDAIEDFKPMFQNWLKAKITNKNLIDI